MLVSVGFDLLAGFDVLCLLRAWFPERLTPNFIVD